MITPYASHMVPMQRMSRTGSLYYFMRRFGILLCSALLLAAPVVAIDAPDEEIIYRVNLGRADDVKLLLQQGASPDEFDENGVPLLALAAQRRDPEGLAVVKALLDAGADINDRDNNDNTALFYAARRGNEETVKYLLEKGIDYYALNDNGDMARSVAFKAGYKNIVEILDNFVKEQTAQTMKRYEDYNRAIAENYRIAEENARKYAEAQAKAAEEAAARVAEEAAREEAEKKEVESKPPEVQAEQVTPPVDQKKAQDDIKKPAYELAFNTCAFQYWYFCSTVKQEVDLTAEELAVAMESNKDNIRKAEDTLQGKYGQTEKFVTGIYEAAKTRMFNQLNSMPTNRARSERGVGRMEDMQNRCTAIAQLWDIELEDSVPEKTGKVGYGELPPPATVEYSTPDWGQNPARTGEDSQEMMRKFNLEMVPAK